MVLLVLKAVHVPPSKTVTLFKLETALKVAQEGSLTECMIDGQVDNHISREAVVPESR